MSDATTLLLNAPIAADDSYYVAEGDGLVFYFDVMSNDAGGNAKTIYSLAIHAEGDLTAADILDLMSSDIGLSSELTELGASISIVDGKIQYDMTAIKDFINNLSAGETAVDTFSYGVRLKNGAVSVATISVNISGASNPNPAIIFSDDFNRADNEALGNGWIEYRETFGSDPLYHGSATVSVFNNQANFHYSYSDGEFTGGSPYVQPFIYHDLDANASLEGFQMEFDITPGDSGRVRQLFGLGDASSGLVSNDDVASNPLILPNVGIGIELMRTNSSYNNSTIKVFQFNGDTDFNYEDPNAAELTAQFSLTQFQFNSGEEYHVAFSVDTENHLTVDVSNGVTHEEFSVTIQGLPHTLDRLFLTSTESGQFGVDKIFVDNLTILSGV